MAGKILYPFINQLSLGTGLGSVWSMGRQIQNQGIGIRTEDILPQQQHLYSPEEIKEKIKPQQEEQKVEQSYEEYQEELKKIEEEQKIQQESNQEDVGQQSEIEEDQNSYNGSITDIQEAQNYLYDPEVQELLQDAGIQVQIGPNGRPQLVNRGLVYLGQHLATLDDEKIQKLKKILNHLKDFILWVKQKNNNQPNPVPNPVPNPDQNDSNNKQNKKNSKNMIIPIKEDEQEPSEQSLLDLLEDDYYNPERVKIVQQLNEKNPLREDCIRIPKFNEKGQLISSYKVCLGSKKHLQEKGWEDIKNFK